MTTAAGQMAAVTGRLDIRLAPAAICAWLTARLLSGSISPGSMSLGSEPSSSVSTGSEPSVVLCCTVGAVAAAVVVGLLVVLARSGWGREDPSVFCQVAGHGVLAACVVALVSVPCALDAHLVTKKPVKSILAKSKFVTFEATLTSHPTVQHQQFGPQQVKAHATIHTIYVPCAQTKPDPESPSSSEKYTRTAKNIGTEKHTNTGNHTSTVTPGGCGGHDGAGSVSRAGSLDTPHKTSLAVVVTIDSGASLVVAPQSRWSPSPAATAQHTAGKSVPQRGVAATGLPASDGLMMGQRWVFRGQLAHNDFPGRTHAQAKVASGQLLQASPWWAQNSHNQRQLLGDFVDEGDPGSALVQGLLIGDTSGVTPHQSEAVKATGLTHLVAVSGGNMVVVATLALLICTVIGVPRRLRYVMAVGAVGSYAVVVGPDSSVMRAVVMSVIALVAIGAGRARAALTALHVAVIGLLTWNPKFSYDYGFMLSVAATLSLLLCLQQVTGRWNHLMGRSVIAFVATPVLATLACTPIIVTLNGTIATHGVLANLLASWVAPLAMATGAVALLTLQVAPVVAHICLEPVKMASQWILLVAQTLAGWPGASVTVGNGPVQCAMCALVCWGALATILWWQHPTAGRSWTRLCQVALDSGVFNWMARKRDCADWAFSGIASGGRASGDTSCSGLACSGSARPGGRGFVGLRLLRVIGRWLGSHMTKVCRMVAAAVLIVASLVALGRGTGLTDPPERGDWLVYACDVGQGTATLVRTGDDSAILADTGSPGRGLGKCLNRAGVKRVDLLVLSHYHLDHVGAVAELVAAVDVGGVWATGFREPEPNALRVDRELAQAGLRVVVPERDHTHRVGHATIRVVGQQHQQAAVSASEPTGTEINNASLAVTVTTRGLRVFLPGDAEIAAQQDLLAEPIVAGVDPLAADVLSVPHHGSAKQLPELFRRVSPQVAVVSAGRQNDYGHPAKRALTMLAKSGTPVRRTDQCGHLSIGAGPDKNSVWVQSARSTC